MACVKDAAVACEFVLERVQRAAGTRWRQGEWRPPIEGGSDEAPVRVLATTRLHRVERAAAQALVAWSGGARDVELLHRAATAREITRMQALGRRCVSLLPEGADTGRHEDVLAFCLHDLCHLEKLNDPEHRRGQMGFFAALDAAMEGDAWAALEARVDDAAWRVDRDYVAADMNGSPIFLFAALKMKLKMAVRRALAREERRVAPAGGPLDAREEAAFLGELARLCIALGFDGEARDAAFAVTTRHAEAAAATTLLTWFERRATEA
jgi:hypothetical protein